MTDRILTKKNLLVFGVFAVLLRAAVALLPWFLPLSQRMITLSDVPILILTVCTIVYVGRRKTPIRFQNAQVLLILFFAWTILACLSMSVTYDNDWVHHNSDPLLNAFVSCMVIFPLGYVLIREKPAAVGRGLFHAFILGWTAFMLIVLIVVAQGKTLSLGMDYGNSDGLIRLYENGLELNCNRNHTGAWEMSFFLLSCFMVLRCRRPALKAIYSAAAAVHYVALILSNSRAAIFSVLLGWIALVGIGVFLRLGGQKRSRRLLIALAAAAVAGAAFFLLRSAVYSLFMQEGRGLTNGADEFTSGRTDLWESALKGIVSSVRSFLFGFTPKSVPDMIAQTSNGRWPASYSHNEFLEIAAGIGVPGLCIFAGWLFLLVRDTYRLFFVQKDRSFRLVLPVIVFVLLLANMAEAHLLFYNHLSGYVFFLLSGMLHGTANAPLPAGHPRLNAAVRVFRDRKNHRPPA